MGLYTLSDFGAVSLLRYETFTWAIFSQYESSLDRTLGAGLSLALVALALAWVALEFVSRGRSRYYSTSSGTTRPSPDGAIGKMALALGCALCFGDRVWTRTSRRHTRLLGCPGRGSRRIAGPAVGGGSQFAVHIRAGSLGGHRWPLCRWVCLSVRHPGLLSGMLERLGYISFALPGIAIALALVFFGANYAGFLYQTIGLLLLGYVALFLSRLHSGRSGRHCCK